MRIFIVCIVLIHCLSAINCSFAQDLKVIKAEGMGMSPTIKDGDKLKIDRNFYKKGSEVKRFDIVAFLLTEEQKKYLGLSGELFHYKRIVGLPNEKIEIKSGQVYINDGLLDEPFVKEIWEDNNFGQITISANEYFVLGDNRPNSADSRIWKPATVKKEDILGKVIEIVPAKK